MLKNEELAGCTCDVCAMEFPHATPNAAVADVSLPSIGWVYVCAGHCPSSVEAVEPCEINGRR